jgi:hypothetical protein
MLNETRMHWNTLELDTSFFQLEHWRKSRIDPTAGRSEWEGTIYKYSISSTLLLFQTINHINLPNTHHNIN